MSKSKGELVVSVSIIPNQQGSPAGKLADAEVMFGAESGPLSGMKLVGFAVWERRAGGRNVTFPARQYSVNGERRSFALLRPVTTSASQDRLRDLILDAYFIYKLHIVLGLTLFLITPFTRLVHIWSAPIWYLGRRGYQVVRSSGRPQGRRPARSPVEPAE